jgi:hypothetical protein
MCSHPLISTSASTSMLLSLRSPRSFHNSIGHTRRSDRRNRSPCTADIRNPSTPGSHSLIRTSAQLLICTPPAPCSPRSDPPVAFTIPLGTHIGLAEGTAAHPPLIFEIRALPALIRPSAHLLLRPSSSTTLPSLPCSPPVAFTVPSGTHIGLTEGTAAHAPLIFEIRALAALFCSSAYPLVCSSAHPQFSLSSPRGLHNSIGHTHRSDRRSRSPSTADIGNSSTPRSHLPICPSAHFHPHLHLNALFAPIPTWPSQFHWAHTSV